MLTQKVDIKPFSEKYIGYYQRCFKNRINCLEGAYRAGKSVINIFSFATYLESCEDKIHLATGASAATARLNIADCNGLGLNYLFRGRCRTSTYEGNDCLRVSTKTGEKIVIFVGGGQSDSYKRIQGLSFGSWISVELANLYISKDEKCFIDMALSRLTQSKCQRIWWDLNPVYPSHKVYTQYLDKYENSEVTGGYNYMKCTLFDNNSLTEKQRQNFISNYPDTSSMEYQRYILGNRACAEGLIFKLFAKDSIDYTASNLADELQKIPNRFISIGVDFGGNGSNTTAVATVISQQFDRVLILTDDLLNMSGGETDAAEFHKFFRDFYLRVQAMSAGTILYAFGDCADPVMIQEMRNVIRELRVPTRVLNCYKSTIKERIDAKRKMIASGKWRVFYKAPHVIESTKTQVWSNKDGHEDERLDDGTCDIDTADAEEYSWSNFIDKLIRRV